MYINSNIWFSILVSNILHKHIKPNQTYRLYRRIILLRINYILLRPPLALNRINFSIISTLHDTPPGRYVTSWPSLKCKANLVLTKSFFMTTKPDESRNSGDLLRFWILDIQALRWYMACYISSVLFVKNKYYFIKGACFV